MTLDAQYTIKIHTSAIGTNNCRIFKRLFYTLSISTDFFMGVRGLVADLLRLGLLTLFDAKDRKRGSSETGVTSMTESGAAVARSAADKGTAGSAANPDKKASSAPAKDVVLKAFKDSGKKDFLSLVDFSVMVYSLVTSSDRWARLAAHVWTAGFADEFTPELKKVRTSDLEAFADAIYERVTAVVPFDDFDFVHQVVFVAERCDRSDDSGMSAPMSSACESSRSVLPATPRSNKALSTSLPSPRPSAPNAASDSAPAHPPQPFSSSLLSSPTPPNASAAGSFPLFAPAMAISVPDPARAACIPPAASATMQKPKHPKRVACWILSNPSWRIDPAPPPVVPQAPLLASQLSSDPSPLHPLPSSLLSLPTPLNAASDSAPGPPLQPLTSKTLQMLNAALSPQSLQIRPSYLLMTFLVPLATLLPPVPLVTPLPLAIPLPSVPLAILLAPGTGQQTDGERWRFSKPDIVINVRLSVFRDPASLSTATRRQVPSTQWDHTVARCARKATKEASKSVKAYLQALTFGRSEFVRDHQTLANPRSHQFRADNTSKMDKALRSFVTSAMRLPPWAMSVIEERIVHKSHEKRTGKDAGKVRFVYAEDYADYAASQMGERPSSVLCA